ncbi:MAG: hypothetical protein HQK49_14525 [Oligoflexia bacterium]|nr:hypothetical protein [Oligoflexia bacterium]
MSTQIFEKRMMIIVFSQLTIGILLALLIVFYKGTNTKNINNIISDESNYLRTLGTKLQGIELNLEAAKSYEKYFEKSLNTIDNETKAKIAFTIGELYKNEGQYEKAIGYYYLVELFDDKSTYKSDAKKEIVALLEKMKKFSAAKWMLNEATSLSSSSAPAGAGAGAGTTAGGDVVAKIGDKKIYLHEINTYLDELPEFVRKNFSKTEEKQNFVKKYVADTMLFEKAKRQGMNNDTKFRQQIERIERELLLQKIFEQEISKKISISESDVKNYYEANKDKFAQKNPKSNAPAPAPKFEEIKKMVTDNYRQEKERDLYQKLIEETLKIEKVELFLDKVK